MPAIGLLHGRGTIARMARSHNSSRAWERAMPAIGLLHGRGIIARMARSHHSA